MQSNILNLPSGELRECDECGKNTVRMSFEEQPFLYGSGDGAVELRARVPVWTCASCGDAYTEGEAEDARHEAVCRHLGVLSPNMIRAIRVKCGLTQAELAKIAGFGVASLKRWETGSLIQNVSADRLLRLIDTDASILSRLIGISRSRVDTVVRSRFRSEISEGTRIRSQLFVLRRVGT